MDQMSREIDGSLRREFRQLRFVASPSLEKAVFEKVALEQERRRARQRLQRTYLLVSTAIAGGMTLIVTLFTLLNHLYPSFLNFDPLLQMPNDMNILHDVAQSIAQAFTDAVHSPTLFFAIPMLFLLCIDAMIRSRRRQRKTEYDI